MNENKALNWTCWSVEAVFNMTFCGFEDRERGNLVVFVLCGLVPGYRALRITLGYVGIP